MELPSRQCAVFLLHKGANPYYCFAGGDGYNIFCSSSAHPDFILKGDQDFSLARPFVEACSARLFVLAATLLNARDMDRNTPLLKAAQNCEIRTVELIVDVVQDKVGLFHQELPRADAVDDCSSLAAP